MRQRTGTDITVPRGHTEVQDAPGHAPSRRRFLGAAAAGVTAAVLGSSFDVSPMAHAVAASPAEPGAAASSGQITRINASVAAGQEFLVTVREVSDGGYVWDPGHVDTGLTMKQYTVRQAVLDHGCTNPPVGGSSLRVFSLTAAAARKAPYTVRLKYTRFGKQATGDNVLITLIVH